jgi:hypothetical protein
LQRRKRDDEFVSVFSVSDTIEESFSSHSPNESPAENSGAATVDVACFARILDENLVENRKTVERCGDAAFLCGYQQRHPARNGVYVQHFDHGRLSYVPRAHLDTGANRKSIMPLEQYRSYCQAFGVPVEIRPVTGRVGGIASSLTVWGVATIPVSLPELNIVCDFEFYLFNGDGPNLLSKLDMKNAGFELLALQDDLLWLGGRAQRLLSINEFMVHKWEPGDLASTLFTDAELLKLHRYFGLPSVEKLSNLLERAQPDEMDVSVRRVLQEIVALCQTCLEHSSPRRHFKLTLGMDEAHINRIVALDVMSLESRNVLHIADEATHFQAAAFLQSNTAEEVWRVFVRLWIRTYLGPPDFIRADQGNNLTAEWFVSSTIAEVIEVLEASTECPTTMSHVERYHAPLRAAYQKFRSDFGFEPEEALELTVKCVNDTVGPGGLTPALWYLEAFRALLGRYLPILRYNASVL